MADINIDIPPQYPSLIAGAIRNAQYSAAPPAPNFDANLAQAKAHAAHIESLRGWAMLAARGHEGAQAVMAHPEVQAKWGRVAPPAPPPAPAPVRAVAPQAPRAVVPAAPQPTATPALAGISRRTEVLTSLLGARPIPAAPRDKTLV